MCSFVYNFIKKNFVKLLLLSLITACESNQHPIPRCVPAELFTDGTTTSVSAYFERDSNEFIANDKTLGNTVWNDHVVRWKYTGYVTNGKPIVLKAEGMWTSWVKNEGSTIDKAKFSFTDDDMDYYDKILSVERICGPYKTIEKTFMPTDQSEQCKVSCQSISGIKDDPDKGIYGPPCWFKSGYGAYLLFRRPGDPDPNETLNHMKYPVSPVLHIGYTPLELGGTNGFSSKDRDIMDNFCKKIELEAGWKIYIKILDRHYYDNIGGYAITFIDGINQEEGSYPLEWVRKKVRHELDTAGQQLFQRVVNNPVFRNLVFSVLTLFLIFGSLAYIFGMVQSPFGDVIVRILKISLIILLISPGSWDFFYNHLLKLFIHGTDQIIAMINSHSGAVYNPERPFAFMDDMIVNKIFSPLIWKVKIRALIIANFGSIFAVVLIIIAVLLYVALCMYAFVIYLTAFIGITFLVGLLPLFLLGILFSQFKSLFDGWLTQCISFSMQAILIFTLLSLFGALIMNYYYRIFGFTTCYNEWMKVKICIFSDSVCLLDKKIYGWTPGQYYDPKVLGIFSPSFNVSDYKDSGDEKNPSKARYRFTSGGAYIDVPPDRKHKDFRYIDYPFLDPDSKSDGDPFGINVAKSSPFRMLSHYINTLLSTDKSYAIARLIDQIRNELNELYKNRHITLASKDNVLKIIDDRTEKDKAAKKSVLEKYRDKSFKRQVVDALIDGVISNAALEPTSQEELLKQYDYNLILRIRGGDMILWSEVGSLLLAALLIWQMRAFVQSVAVSLAGGSMMSQTIASMYEAGFLNIFSGIPVIGKVFEKIDNTIDAWKLWSGNMITKVARTPLRVLHKVPYLGKIVKFTGGAAGALTSTYSEYDRSPSSSFKQLNYVRAFIGAHLGFSPLDAMKYLGGHIVGKMTGNVDGGLIHNALEDRRAALDSLKAYMLGPDQHKPLLYIPNKKDEEDESNPFSKALPKKSSSLFDEAGNLVVNKENLKDALDAREQLKTMRGNTKDEAALQKINYDIDRLDTALRNHLGDNFDNVVGDYAKSCKPVEHPKDLVDPDLSRLDTSSTAENGELPRPRLDDGMQSQSQSEGSSTLNVTEEEIARPDLNQSFVDSASSGVSDVAGSDTSSTEGVSDRLDSGDGRDALPLNEDVSRIDNMTSTPLDLAESSTIQGLDQSFVEPNASSNDMPGSDTLSREGVSDRFDSGDSREALPTHEDAMGIDNMTSSALDVTENAAMRDLDQSFAEPSTSSDILGDGDISTPVNDGLSVDGEHTSTLSASEDEVRLSDTVDDLLEQHDAPLVEEHGFAAEAVEQHSMDLPDILAGTFLAGTGTEQKGELSDESDEHKDPSCGNKDSDEYKELADHKEFDSHHDEALQDVPSDIDTEEEKNNLFQQDDPGMHGISSYEGEDDTKVFGNSDAQDSNKLEEDKKEDFDPAISESRDEGAAYSVDMERMEGEDSLLVLPVDMNVESGIYDINKIQQETEQNLFVDKETLEQDHASDSSSKPKETESEHESSLSDGKEGSSESDDVSKKSDEREDSKGKSSNDADLDKIDHSKDSPDIIAQVVDTEGVQPDTEQILGPEVVYPTSVGMPKKEKSITESGSSMSNVVDEGPKVTSEQVSETKKVDTKKKKTPDEKKDGTSKAKNISSSSIFKDFKLLINEYGKQMSSELSNVFDNFFKDFEDKKYSRKKQSKEEAESMINYLKDVISLLKAEKSRLTDSHEIQIIEEKIKSVESAIRSILSNQE